MSAGKQAAENGEYDRAIASYQEVLRHDPKNAIAQAGLVRATKAKQTEEQVLNPH
jgi:cytochrome c-type biogenesis protein CcmH/NrfG